MAVHLMGELVKCVTPGRLILDHFKGSASSGVAALQNGYHFIGVEKTAHYFDISCRRMEEHVKGDLASPVPEQSNLAIA